MATSGDPQLEHRALLLFRELLDQEPQARALALQSQPGALRERVQALLACMAEDDLAESPATGGDIAGQRIGPYVLLERLGHGGMGEVFLARRADGAFERQVAIKRIWAGHAPLAARFVRERQLLARLQHPHIAQLLDGGLDAQGKPWLAMELVRGQHIAHWCDEHRAPLARRVELLCQVCDAVDHAHRQLIVHRDIKPSNILVDAEGHARLLDFGIARLLDDEDGEHTQTHAMTPAWATPEQRLGLPTTTASDIYQLGLLARALLCGMARTEDGERMSAGCARLRRTEPQRAADLAGHRALAPEALQRQLRGDLDSIVAVATAEDAGTRYPSARALAEDLRRWLHGQPVQARTEERGYRLRRHARRWWPALAAGVAALAFLGFHVHSLQDALGNTRLERARALAAEQDARAAQARAEQERNTANAVSDYFIRMFNMLGAESIRGEHPATVGQLLDAGAGGLDQVAASGERSPEALSAMWRSMSAVHRNLGEHQRALELADKAAASARAAGSPVALAEALRARSGALHWLGRNDEAFQATLQAVAQLDGDPRQYGTLPAKLHDDLSWGYRERGQYARSMQHARISIDSLRRDPQTVRRQAFVQALNNGADTAIAAGDLAQARAWLDEGMRLYPRLANPSPGILVMLEANLAILDLREDHVDAARTRLQALLASARAQFGEAHPRTNLARDYLTLALLAGNEPAAALDGARALLASSTATYGANHAFVAEARGLLLVALLLADRHGEAATLLDLLGEPCDTPAVNASAQLVRTACARARGDAPALDEAATRLSTHRDHMPWQARIAARWRRELAATPATATP